MPTTANTITYYVAADGTLRDGAQGAIAQQPRINYGTDYAVTLTFPASTIAEGDQLQVALNRTRTFFSSASATGDAPVAAVVKHDVTAEEAAAQEVAVVLSTNTRAMIDQVNGIDHPVRGFFGVHVLRGQSFVTLAIADALMMSLESGPDAISPSLPVVDYPTRAEAEALTDRSEAAADRAEEAAAGIVPPLQLDAPPTTSTVGSVGQLAVWHDAENNKDHLYHLCYITEGESATLYHWEECVLLDENGKVASEVLPVASTNVLGAVKCSTDTFNGLYIASETIRLIAAQNAHIDSRRTNRPIVPVVLEYAVRSVLPKVTEIPAATSDYSLVDSSATTNNHSHVYSHSPSLAPTYRLPQVTDTTIAHYIELTVNFAAVQTYSFLDHQGEPIVPLFTPAIAAGDVYTFKMEYSAIKAAWLIYPQKQGAVADDFVMRGEVGAANGVAGLDANGKLPPAQLPIIISTTAPPTSTVGVIGQLYVDTATSKTYHCTAITNTGTESDPVWSYAWTDDINANGGNFKNDVWIPSNSLRIGKGSWNDFRAGTRSLFIGDGYGIAGNGSFVNCLVIGNVEGYASGSHNRCIFGGTSMQPPGSDNQIAFGKFGITRNAAVVIGGGSQGHFLNIEELSWNGDLYIAGGHQQGITIIPAATSAYTLAEGIFTHAPTNAPTYTLPNITDDIRTHEVVLIIDFSSVQTFSFLVDGGGDVTFQSYANPTMGDVWAFRCWWYGGKWRICPTKIKNCVTRQLANGSLSITDAVAGDALALRMNAPRSVVVNQHINATDTSVTLTSGRTWMTYIGGVGAKVTGEGQSVACTGGTDMAIDLTQYFNGDSALIDSIQSWDDLVAYDPRFASYVAYNAGEVVGVTPSVSINNGTAITSPSELFAVGNAADEFEAVSGVTTRKVGVCVDLGSLNWDLIGSTFRTTDITDAVRHSSSVFTGAIMTNGYSEVAGQPSANHTFAINSDAGVVNALRVIASEYSTKETFTSAMSGVMLYYELATPTTSQSTPTQIALQAGSNTIQQTDGGRLAPIDITYESDEL